MADDTIFALSSGRPPAGIAVIRVCGPGALETHRRFCGWDALSKPRRARVARLRDPADGVLLDEALVIHFAAPASVTGEDMAEWHCHGGQAVVRAVLAALGRQPGLREAEPGEFTRRAFENGRIDLNEAEGLADLLAAETEAQRRAALSMAQGGFSRLLEQWRNGLLTLSAQVEAELDFADEGDVEEADLSGFAGRLAALQSEVAQALTSPRAERLRDGVRVTIAGPPNAGKSTLLNALVGREAAIVSDIAGTTRDRIEAVVGIAGVPFVFTDTAGLRSETDSEVIERIGMGRAREAMREADLVLWLGAVEEAPEGSLAIGAQCDREGFKLQQNQIVAISARTGEGMDALIALLLDRARTLLPREGEMALHRRQREGVEAIHAALGRASTTQDMLIIAEELRAALRAIDRLVGSAGVEDMLDTLFGRFCIGK